MTDQAPTNSRSEPIGLAGRVQGPEVARTQEYLARFGYLADGPDGRARTGASLELAAAVRGVMDEATTEALRLFQEFNGLQPTGVLDEPTAALMARPRCGVPDVPGSSGAALAHSSPFTLSGLKWPRANLTFSFDNFTADLQQQQVEQAMTQAMGLWSSVTHLEFHQVTAAQGPDIHILFAAGAHGTVPADDPFDGTGGSPNVLAHAFFPPPNGGDIAGDAHFDEAETWSAALPVPAGAIDLLTVAAHEFGHSLGLDHSTVPGALMAPFYTLQRFLAPDDIAGI